MNKRYFKPIIAALLLLLAQGRVTAQEVGGFTFSHIGQAEGMHSQRVYGIVQTSDGALWWSTKNDVERYNGVTIKHYTLGDPDIFSDYAGRRIKLYNHFDGNVKAPETSRLMAYDNKGRIFDYDEAHDKFVLEADVRTKQHELTDLNDVLKTDKGLWLATNLGVFFLHGDSLLPVVKGYYANCLIRTDKSLLLCTRQGVLEYRQSLQEVPRANAPLKTIVPYDVESGYFDPIYNKVWLGGYSSGIRVLTADGKAATGYQEKEIGITHNPVRVIYPYDMHTMLVGIDGLGVYKVSRRQQASENYTATLLFNANEGPNGVLHGNGIYALVRDIWGNIAIGSYSGGIDIARPVGTTVDLFQHVPHNQQSLLNDHVNCVIQAPSGKLLMGTDNGVSIFDLKNRTWQHACLGTVVLSMCQSPRGTILAATYGQGVLELTENGGSKVLYSTANGSLQDDHVFKVMYDRDGNLWMGGLDGDLVQLTANGPRYYPVHYVKDMLQLPDGRIVIGTTYGIRLIHPVTGKTTELAYTPTNDNGEEVKDVNRFVHTLYLHDNKELWIGTDGGGIYIYNPTTKQCRQLTTKNGLPSNFVNTIYRDTKGRVVIATEQGLSFADPKNPARIIGVNYCYGVDREYVSRAAINLDNGYMVLGSTTGALVINPNHIQEIDYTAKLYLTGVNCGDNNDDDFKERIHEQLRHHKLELPYSQRTFELFFESINLRNQSDIGYQYRVDKGKWSTIFPQQYIRFTSMEPGKHHLMLRSVSRTCGAVLDEVSLTIRIGYPWWNTWWMWCIYIILLLLLFYGAWHVYQLHDKYMRLVVDNLNRSSAAMPLSLDNPDGPEIAENPDAPEDESNQFISQATKLVIDNISDSEFTIDRLCREMAMSRTLFYVKLKSYTGKSPQDFMRIIRLERAASLLRNGRNVTDAAALAGFDNPKYFSTVFKKYFGVSPSKYQ